MKTYQLPPYLVPCDAYLMDSLYSGCYERHNAIMHHPRVQKGRGVAKVGVTRGSISIYVVFDMHCVCIHTRKNHGPN